MTTETKPAAPTVPIVADPAKEATTPPTVPPPTVTPPAKPGETTREGVASFSCFA